MPTMRPIPTDPSNTMPASIPSHADKPDFPMSATFSLLLPEGRQVALQKWSPTGVLRATQLANESRQGRGLVTVLLLNRTTGRVFPAAALGAYSASLPDALLAELVAPVEAPPHKEGILYHTRLSIPWTTCARYASTLVLRHDGETLVVHAPAYQDAQCWVGSASRPWEAFICNETDTISRAWSR